MNKAALPARGRRFFHNKQQHFNNNIFNNNIFNNNTSQMDEGSAEGRLASLIDAVASRNAFISGALFNADRFYVTQQQFLTMVHDYKLKVQFFPSSVKFVLKYATNASSEYNVKMKRFIRGLYSPKEEVDDFDYTQDTLEFETSIEKGVYCLLNIPFHAVDASAYDIRELAEIIAVLNEYHTPLRLARIMLKALDCKPRQTVDVPEPILPEPTLNQPRTNPEQCMYCSHASDSL